LEDGDVSIFRGKEVMWENEGMYVKKGEKKMVRKQASRRRWALKGALLSDLLTAL
jgi:hypothetical protein